MVFASWTTLPPTSRHNDHAAQAVVAHARKKNSTDPGGLASLAPGGDGWRPHDTAEVGPPQPGAVARAAGPTRASPRHPHHPALGAETGLFAQGQPQTLHRAAAPRQGPPVPLHCPAEEAIRLFPK